METPTSEALIAEAFASGLLITADRASRLLGVDPKTLKAMVAAGLIRTLQVGSSDRGRRFTEGSIREFLASAGPPELGPEAASRVPANRGRRYPTFTEIRAAKGRRPGK